MKFIKRFLLLVFCAIPCVAGAQIATTAGSNLTAWNGNSGATNNNNWNNMMNSRTLAAGNMPAADFGNCNALILRCAQPKCAGCTTVDLARSVVTGCVNSNATCKQYGNDLIEYISAQIVANANSKMQEQQLAAQQAAAQQAAAQNSAQMQQMQEQMAQMQQQMQAQNAAQMQQMQAALEQQQALAAKAQSDALAAQQAQRDAEAATLAAAEAAKSKGVSGHEITAAQRVAAESGVSEDLVARQTISGEILTAVENAELEFKELGVVMREIFEYGGCDSRGNNCKGPKRVKIFKDKAEGFFEPYDDIVDAMYEALELSLVVGVDVSDVIMMLSGACNRWGKYMCRPDSGGDDKSDFTKAFPVYDSKDCPAGKSVGGMDGSVVRGGQECRVGMVIPPQDDVRCTLTSLVNEGTNRDLQRDWVIETEDGDGLVKLGCASSALDGVAMFGRRNNKKASAVELDVLERIVLQDAPEFSVKNKFISSNDSDAVERTKYCAVTETGYKNLIAALTSQDLPKEICVNDDRLTRLVRGGPALSGVAGVASGIQITGVRDKTECEQWNLAARQSVSGCSAQWKDGVCKYYGYCVLEGNEFKKSDKSAGTAQSVTGGGGALADDPSYNEVKRRNDEWLINEAKKIGTSNLKEMDKKVAKLAKGPKLSKEAQAECKKIGGTPKSDGYCYCGKQKMTQSQNCNKGKLEGVSKIYSSLPDEVIDEEDPVIKK